MYDYIGNKGDRGGKTRWTSASSNPTWDFLLSEVWCRPSMEGLYWVILHFHHEGSDYGYSMEIWVSKCWCCSLQSGEFILFLRNCKVRDWGCVCGGYFRVVAPWMWCSCWKTGSHEATCAPGGAEPRRMVTLGQHVLQGWVLKEGYGRVTSCVELLVNYDGSFMIDFYVHLFFFYILYLGSVKEIFASVLCPGKVLEPWCCLGWRALRPSLGEVQGIDGWDRLPWGV